MSSLENFEMEETGQTSDVKTRDSESGIVKAQTPSETETEDEMGSRMQRVSCFAAKYLNGEYANTSLQFISAEDQDKLLEVGKDIQLHNQKVDDDIKQVAKTIHDETLAHLEKLRKYFEQLDTKSQIDNQFKYDETMKLAHHIEVEHLNQLLMRRNLDFWEGLNKFKNEMEKILVKSIPLEKPDSKKTRLDSMFHAAQKTSEALDKGEILLDHAMERFKTMFYVIMILLFFAPYYEDFKSYIYKS